MGFMDISVLTVEGLQWNPFLLKFVCNVGPQQIWYRYLRVLVQYSTGVGAHVSPLANGV